MTICFEGTSRQNRKIYLVYNLYISQYYTQHMDIVSRFFLDIGVREKYNRKQQSCPSCSAQTAGEYEIERLKSYDYTSNTQAQR